MFYQELFAALSGAQIRYLVVGAVAMNLHGAPRMTADLDLVVDLEPSNLAKMLEALAGLGYRPRLPVPARDLLDESKRRTWVDEKHLVAFTFNHPKIPYQEVDVLLRSPVPFDTAYAERRVLEAGTTSVPVMSIDHLIVMKRHAGREQDLSDIAILERIKQLRNKDHHA